MTRVSLLSLHALLSLSVVACGGADTDADGDKYPMGEDCNDGDPSINPGAAEICGDFIDNNCDGFDADCGVDADGDGFLSDDDCNDADPNVNPGAGEDCFNDIDDDCNGVITKCIAPTMIYDTTSSLPTNPYSTAVHADRVIFGEPGNIGDGEAHFFDIHPGTVDTDDALLSVLGEANADSGFGIVLSRVSDFVCFGADYFDAGAGDNAGKTYCFDEATLEGATGTLLTTDAVFSVTGAAVNGFATVDAVVDVDGDGLEDLVVYSSRGVDIIVGDGTPWTGAYDIATDGTISLGQCESSVDSFCGFGRATLREDPPALLIAGDGSPNQVSWFDLPLNSTPYIPDSLLVTRTAFDSSSSVASLSGFAVGNSGVGEVTLLDGSMDASVLQLGSGEFGYWIDEGVDQSGHPLLAVSAPAATTGEGGGLIYVFDLELTPRPGNAADALYILLPPGTFSECGSRTDIGTVTDDEIGSRTVISSACPGSGGAVYELDLVAPAAPPPPPQSITQTGARRFEIDQLVVDTYVSRLEWIQSLAQTKMVTEGNQIVGWELSGIEDGSVVDRLGLRNGDIVQTVNGQALTTRGVVRDVTWGLRLDTFFALDVLRNGNPKRYRYSIVP